MACQQDIEQGVIFKISSS